MQSTIALGGVGCRALISDVIDVESLETRFANYVLDDENL